MTEHEGYSSRGNHATGARASKYLVWRVGERVFATPLSHIREIIAMPPMTDLPEFHRMLKGVFNLRGKIISVADVRTKLAGNGPGVVHVKRPYVIALEAAGCEIGVVVDDIVEVILVAQQDIKKDIDVQSSTRIDQRYVEGVFSRPGNAMLVMILDMPHLLGVGVAPETHRPVAAVA